MIDIDLSVQHGAGFRLAVQLQLPAQGVTVLFGPSGCGKTTLLRAVAGLVRAQGHLNMAGEVWQDDAQRLWRPPHERAVGYVIQEAALFPHLSVRGNLDFAVQRSQRGISAGAPLPASTLDLDGLIQLLGLAPLLARAPGTLSGGERQRVAMARALASAPRCLLMDEPLAALDADRKAELLPYLEQLHQALRLPVLYVTHALAEAARLADHLVLLRDGQVQAHGALAGMLARTDLPLARQDDAGVVIDARVLAHDTAYGLMQIGFAGGSLWLGASPASPGARVRARVLARDVSVARLAPQQSSLVNVLPVRLQSLQVDGHTVLLRLAMVAEPAGERTNPSTADEVHLLARITRRSCEALGLAPGDPLFAQIKGVALM